MEDPKVFKCPDPECVDGKIITYNAYAKNPLEGKEQPCDLCQGMGFLISTVVEGKPN